MKFIFVLFFLLINILSSALSNEALAEDVLRFSKIFSKINDVSVFEKTLYPHLRTRCVTCHESKQAPFFASADPLTAYDEAKKRIDSTTPLRSKLWIRSQNSHCENASLCGYADLNFMDSIKEWILKDSFFQIPTETYDWKSESKRIDLNATVPTFFHFDIQPDLSFEFLGEPLGQSLYYFHSFKILNLNQAWYISQIRFHFSSTLKARTAYLEKLTGILPITKEFRPLNFNPAFLVEVNATPAAPEFQISLKNLIPASEELQNKNPSLLVKNLTYSPKVIAVKAGSSRTCALFENNKIKCFGNNSNGELGHHWDSFQSGNLSWGDSSFETDENIPELHLPALDLTHFLKSGMNGQSHVCFNESSLLNPSEMVCVGSNQFGQLGVEGLPPTPTQKLGAELSTFPKTEILNLSSPQTDSIEQISSGQAFNCVLFQSGKIKCFGQNFNGELGLGDKVIRGVAKNTMKDALPYLNSESMKVTKISSGNNHSCALVMPQNEVHCFGTNRYGELGSTLKGSYGDEVGEIFDQSPAITLSKNEGEIIDLISGANHNCVLFKNGKAECWGRNTYGQLGLGDSLDRNLSAFSSPETAIHEFLKIPNSQKITTLSAGGQNTCALTDKNKIYCYGKNDSGQLGIGNTNNRGSLLNEVGENALEVTLPATDKIDSLSVGANHVCVALLNGGLKCWGSNSYGQLGLGDTLSVGKNPVDLLNLNISLLNQQKEFR